MLRPYQREAVDALLQASRERTESPLVIAPTGAGKSHIIGNFSKEWRAENLRKQLVIVSHRKEILSQNAQKLLECWPDAPLGIFSAGLNSKRIAGVTIAGIQTAYKYAKCFDNVGCVLFDEVHLVPKKGNGQYQSFIKTLKEINPGIFFCGLTATPYRLDSGVLTEGPDAIFTDICFDIPIRDLVEAGYLARLVSKASRNQADLSEVRIVGGEYVNRDAEKALDSGELTERALREVIELGRDRKSWLFFCSGVSHAAHVTDALRGMGITAEMITGETLPMIRDQRIARFKRQEFQAMVNCDVLTIGFDAPSIDLLALLRPTKSTSLYVQMLGRGMRTAPGKQDCLVLDYAGNIEEHGPIDCIVVEGKKVKSKDGREKTKREVKRQKTKICHECRSPVSLERSECQDCGFIFPIEAKHQSFASEASPMLNLTPEQLAELNAPKWVDVMFSKYKSHKSKTSGTTMLLATHMVSFGEQLKEWVCLEHEGFARKKAGSWWVTSGGSLPVPGTVEEALSRIGELLKIKRAFVQQNLGDSFFPKVLEKEFHDQREKSEYVEEEPDSLRALINI